VSPEGHDFARSTRDGRNCREDGPPFSAEGLALDADQADALGLLALVAGQVVEPGEQDGTWRIAKKVAKDG
jgi:hypothetical protein